MQTLQTIKLKFFLLPYRQQSVFGIYTTFIVRKPKSRNRMENKPKKLSTSKVISYVVLAILAAGAINGFYQGAEGANLEPNKTSPNNLVEIDSFAIARADRLREVRRIEAAEKAKAKESEIKRAMRLVKTREDEFEGTTWYYGAKMIPYSNSNRFFVYMGKKENAPWLRLRIQYAGDNWLFMRSATVKVDGVSYGVVPPSSVERDNDGNGVWEWMDFSPKEYEMEMIRAISTSKKAIIRHKGDQYKKDRTISSGEKKALRDILSLYDAMRS